MTKDRFYVDWSDPAFPEIKTWNTASPDSPQTWTECKTEIDNYCAGVLNHWHYQRRYWSRQTKPQSEG